MAIEEDDTANATGTVTANFALQHFTAAKLFAEATGRLEANRQGAALDAVFSEIRAYCSGTVLSAAAALEALINELYIAHSSPLRTKLLNFEEDFWGKRGIERKPIMHKYERALQILRLPPLDKTSSTYKDTDSLVKLRNTLIHFKPTYDGKPDELDKLEAALAGRFALSTWPDSGSDYITNKCMSAGCANWAVATCRTFIAEFAKASQLDKKKLDAFV